MYFGGIYIKLWTPNHHEGLVRGVCGHGTCQGGSKRSGEVALVWGKGTAPGPEGDSALRAEPCQ